MVDDAAPQVRETPEPFTSAIRKALAGRTEALEEPKSEPAKSQTLRPRRCRSGRVQRRVIGLVAHAAPPPGVIL